MLDADGIISEMETYCAQNTRPAFPVVIIKGDGVWVEDLEGNRYLDMFSSFSTLNFGHRHPKIIAAMERQLKEITLTSRAFYNDKLGPFSKHVCEISGFDMVLPMTTGTEAIETAIKLARKWGYRKKGVKQNMAEIIVCENNYHGASTTIAGFSSDPRISQDYGPFSSGFKKIPFNNAEALEEAIRANTVAFLVEPIQAESGIIVPKQGYLKEVRQICSRNDVLLILDEIQTGLGRTGRLFAFQHEGIVPDILVLGKALGGGILPTSAVLAPREIMSLYTHGTHGSTFGGNPLACAVADAALSVIAEEGLVENARQMGEYLMHQLGKMKTGKVRELRGKGLLLALEIKKTAGNVRPLCEKLLKLGVLVKAKGDQTIRLAPPLIISKEQLDWAIQGIEQVLES